MSLYTVAYNYCTAPKNPSSGDLGLSGGRGERHPCFLLSNPNAIAAGANLMGSDLYNNLIRYFVCHLKLLRDVRREFRRVRDEH